MAMDLEEFKKLLETVKNNTAPAVLDLDYKLDEAQTLTLIETLKTNVSVRSLVLARRPFCTSKQFGPKVTMALASLLQVNRSLQSLDLKHNRIGAEGAAALAPAVKESRLQSLYLGSNWIGAEGAAALAPAIKESHLQNLDLGGNQIGAEGAQALAPAIKESSLQSLDLGCNEIGAEGAKALAPAIKGSSLQSLDLRGNRIKDEGAKALSPAIKDCRLQSLFLWNNQIGAEGAKALAPAIKESHLQSLDLSGNEIKDEGAKALSPAIKDCRLQSLYLGSNWIGAEGAAALAPAIKESHLQSLDLGWNGIGAEGAAALAPAVKESHLQSLNLDGNEIGAEGAAALAPAVKESRLQSLNLGNNRIGDEGAKNLSETLSGNRSLHTLALGNNNIKAAILTELEQKLALNTPEFKAAECQTFLSGFIPRLGQQSSIQKAFVTNFLYDENLIGMIFTYTGCYWQKEKTPSATVNELPNYLEGGSATFSSTSETNFVVSLDSEDDGFSTIKSLGSALVEQEIKVREEKSKLEPSQPSAPFLSLSKKKLQEKDLAEFVSQKEIEIQGESTPASGELFTQTGRTARKRSRP